MKKKDPPILVTRPSLPPLEEYQAYVAQIFESHYLTNGGSLHQKLEAALKEKLGVDQLTLFTNGHLALETCIAAFGFDGGEIVTTPFTFVSTTHAIVRCGLTPVFADVKRDDLTLDPNSVEACITPRTRAILPVHVYGVPCDTERIERIAKAHDLKVIYDAAHTFGETVGGTSIAAFGDASMFSFHATKSFHSIEGGAVVCRDEAFASRLRALKNFGYDASEEIDLVGGNAKMSEFQAAMGLCNLAHFEEEIQKRAAIVRRYRARLSNVDGLALLPERPDVKSNCAYFPVRFEPEAFSCTRDDVDETLRSYGIIPRKYFYPLTSQAACYQGRFDAAKTPVALNAADSVLTLPLYADLKLEDVDDICEIILSLKR